MIDKIGWLGSMLLAGCTLPEVWNTILTQHTSLTWGFLLMWFFGLIFTLIFTVNKSKKINIIQVISYLGLNFVGVVVLLIYKVRELL